MEHGTVPPERGFIPLVHQVQEPGYLPGTWYNIIISGSSVLIPVPRYLRYHDYRNEVTVYWYRTGVFNININTIRVTGTGPGIN